MASQRGRTHPHRELLAWQYGGKCWLKRKHRTPRWLRGSCHFSRARSQRVHWGCGPWGLLPPKAIAIENLTRSSSAPWCFLLGWVFLISEHWANLNIMVLCAWAFLCKGQRAMSTVFLNHSLFYFKIYRLHFYFIAFYCVWRGGLCIHGLVHVLCHVYGGQKATYGCLLLPHQS